jgi:hypothetical protein
MDQRLQHKLNYKTTRRKQGEHFKVPVLAMTFWIRLKSTFNKSKTDKWHYFLCFCTARKITNGVKDNLSMREYFQTIHLM